jgi:hypothetical protein
MLIGAFIAVRSADWNAPWSATSWTVSASVENAEHEAECKSDVAKYGMAEGSKRLSCLLAEDWGNNLIQIDGHGTVPMPDGFDKLPHDQQKKVVDQIVETNWHDKFFDPLFHGLGVTLAISLAVYGILRAIGWVIGGFAAS